MTVGTGTFYKLCGQLRFSSVLNFSDYDVFLQDLNLCKFLRTRVEFCKKSALKKKLIKYICRGDSATKRGRDSSVGIREEANQYQYIYQYQSVCLAVGASLPQAVDRAAFPSYQNISIWQFRSNLGLICLTLFLLDPYLSFYWWT